MNANEINALQNELAALRAKIARIEGLVEDLASSALPSKVKGFERVSRDVVNALVDEVAS